MVISLIRGCYTLVLIQENRRSPEWLTEPKILAGFGLALACLALIGLVQYRTIQALVETDERAAHSDAVLSELKGAFSALQIVESDSRGYALTGYEVLLPSYKAGISSAKAHLQKLRKLSGERPRLQLNLDRLESLSERKIAFMDRVIATSIQQGLPAVVQLISQGEGLRLMAEIRSLVDTMEAEENRLLELDQSASRSTARNARAISALGTLLAIVLVLSASWMVHRDLAARRRSEDALRRKKEDLKQAQRIAQVGSWEWTPETGAAAWSDQLYRISGRDPALAAPSYPELAEIYTPESWERLKAAIENTVETGAPYELDLELRLPSGSTRSVIARGEVERDANGKVTRLLGTVQDVTDVRRAEQELRRQSRMNEAFFTQGVSCFVLLDAKYNFIRVNEAYARACGRKVEDFPGRNHFDLYPSEAKAIFDEVVATKKRFQVWARPFTFPDDSGRGITHWDWTLDPILDDRGEVEFLAFTLNEVTERVRAEQALRQSAERYRSLVIATAQIVWTTNPQGEVVEDIPSWREYTGQSEQEAKGWGWINAVHPDDRERTAEIWTRAVATRSLYQVDYRVRRRDGEYRYVSVRGTPVLEADGTIREWVGTCTDVTERKQAEEEILKLNEELEKRVGARTAQLEASNKELEAFSYSVSHDLRAPLRAINGFSRILVQEHRPELSREAQHFLDVIQQNATHMGHLVDDLLAFSRLNREPLRRHRVAPAAVAMLALEDLHGERDGRRVDFQMCGDLPPCEADPRLLRQVFVNLISNALKYSRARDPATIEVGAIRFGDLGRQGAALPDGIWDPETPVYYVRDNGVGFDMRYAAKLFGVFQRLHRAEDYEGTGVGLATVQRIVHRHGGNVWAQAELNRGATFYFTIGAASKAAAQTARTAL